MCSKRLVRRLVLTALTAVSVMAVSASAAQAKYLLLLNGVSVSSMSFNLTILSIFAEAENGLKVECSGGTGASKASLSEENKKLTGKPSATLTGCVWVGVEKTCTINDGGVGQIKITGNDEMAMIGEEFRLAGGSAPIATIQTEGALCTIPEEEEISGTAHATILEPLVNTKVKLAHFGVDSIKLGVSKVKKVVGEMHISDASEPNATFGIHLVNL